MMNSEFALELKNVCFDYANKNQNLTIENFSLQVEKGSFTTLLGPSGCGKTTLLRLISGFLEPSDGEIFVNNVNMKGISPEKRKIGMVFQDYALFPHMSVEQNILYGLKANNKTLKLSKDQMKEKLQQIAQSLDLSELLSRYPHELSGGQQQRVALARALILNPTILLMDEPLSSLDTKLREKVREELKDIQKKFGITTIYVTHDQDEALSLSDKIAVINEGKLLQLDSPRDIFYKPKDRFVADFIGRANFFDEEDLIYKDGVAVDDANSTYGDKNISLRNENSTYVVRPQWFCLNKSDKKGEVEGTVISYAFLGDKTRFRIQIKNPHEKIVIADLPTLEANFLEMGGAVSLNITHKWKL